MHHRTGRYTLAVVALATVGLTACKVDDTAASAPSTGSASSGDVVIATSTSRHSGTTTHYVACGPDPNARLGDYRVTVSAEVVYSARAGDPCPAGPHLPMPREQHPQLYREMSKAMNEPPCGPTLDDCFDAVTTEE